MMCPDAKVKNVYLYPKPVDFQKSIDGLAALVELDIKVAVFDPVLFVFLNRHRNRVKILYWERNGFCLWLKRLKSERFKTSHDVTEEAIVLSVQELNWLLDGFDLWRNRPHQLALFNEPESEPMTLVGDADEVGGVYGSVTKKLIHKPGIMKPWGVLGSSGVCAVAADPVALHR